MEISNQPLKKICINYPSISNIKKYIINIDSYFKIHSPFFIFSSIEYYIRSRNLVNISDQQLIIICYQLTIQYHGTPIHLKFCGLKMYNQCFELKLKFEEYWDIKYEVLNEGLNWKLNHI